MAIVGTRFKGKTGQLILRYIFRYAVSHLFIFHVQVVYQHGNSYLTCRRWALDKKEGITLFILSIMSIFFAGCCVWRCGSKDTG